MSSIKKQFTVEILDSANTTVANINITAISVEQAEEIGNNLVYGYNRRFKAACDQFRLRWNGISITEYVKTKVEAA